MKHKETTYGHTVSGRVGIINQDSLTSELMFLITKLYNLFC